MSLIRYVRVLRLLKFMRLYELMQIVKIHSNFPEPIAKFIQLFFIFILSAHFMACSYIFIGQREVGRNRRYDN